MAESCCLLFTIVDDTSTDTQITHHLELGHTLLGDDAPVVELEAPDGTGSVMLAAARDRDALAELRGRTPLAAERHVMCGVDPSAIADGVSRSPGGYVDLVLDPAEPPIPFDDPTVLGVFRDYHRSYLPLLGRRHLRCESLWRDGVRAAGSFVAFAATDDGEAFSLAAANPWRRVAHGRLLLLPPDVLRAAPSPPGPGTQRSAHFPCGHSGSVAEPGVDRQAANRG